MTAVWLIQLSSVTMPVSMSNEVCEFTVEMLPSYSNRESADELLAFRKELAGFHGEDGVGKLNVGWFQPQLLGLNDFEAQSAIRFSVGRDTTTDDVDFALARYRDAVLRLRAIGA